MDIVTVILNYQYTERLAYIQGGPKVGIQLLNYFLCALKLPAVHFMWPKSRHTVNGENYLEILCEVVVPQLQTKPNFKEYVKNKEKNPKTVNELEDCIYDAFREIDAN